tara:strand:+ start:1573 stop:2073 length:501 start_codon:yes stop_codon:yes gene_type:complete
MGRSNNSFTGYVGQSNLPEGQSQLPETSLWVAVLSRAALDACKGPPHLDMTLPCNNSHHNAYTYNRDQAQHFFLEGGAHFNLICELAGRNPIYVQQRVKKILLRKKGWNVDVPITSHYRQGPKKKKKHLTGNKYYAAKAAKGPKSFYYVGMGSKGGRPRIYNKIEQ